MPTASRNGLNLYFETFGDDEAPPVLLVAGLGMQLVDWPPQWLDRFVEEGYFVVAFDNRDIGLSTHLSSEPPLDIAALAAGASPRVPYYLADMADDAVAVLEAVNIAAAHVVGVSMGGMIAQQIAINHLGRVRSLCSIMSTTGASGVGQPTPEVLAELLAPPPRTREKAIDRSLAISRLIGSPGFSQDEVAMRAAAARSYDRAHDPDGVARQLLAIVASPDRTGGLGHVTVPTVVIHGTADPLVRPDGGEATAAAIPGARLVMMENMGHDLPPELWDEMVEVIVDNMARGDAEGAQVPIS
jgi:pimeloyl-ACP methyl ester carboxylesterase